MAEEKDGKDADTELEAAGSSPAKRKLTLNPAMIMALANLVFITVAFGLFVYTKLLYQRPVINEATELTKRQEELKQPATVSDRAIVPFDQLRINIASTSDKAHYATIAFAIECRDQAMADAVKQRRDIFIDKMIGAMGKRQMTELNTVQGKLVLKSDLIRQFNALLEPAAVTDIFFSTFVLQ